MRCPLHFMFVQRMDQCGRAPLIHSFAHHQFNLQCTLVHIWVQILVYAEHYQMLQENVWEMNRHNHLFFVGVFIINIQFIWQSLATDIYLPSFSILGFNLYMMAINIGLNLSMQWYIQLPVLSLLCGNQNVCIGLKICVHIRFYMADIPKSQGICTIEQVSTNSRETLDRFVVTFERVLGFIQLIDQQQTVVRISQFLTKKLNKEIQRECRNKNC